MSILEFENKLNKYRSMIDSSISDVYNDGPISLLEPINHVLKSSGKRLRPILLMLVADIHNLHELALKPGICIEMLHNFTLIHDDIMDKDTLRHGVQTVHVKWDDDTAILSGDAMLSIAMRELVKIDDLPNKEKILEVFINGLLAVCEGQALDKEFEKNNDVTLENYLDMINKKTAHMIGMSSEIGSLILDLSLDESYHFKKFGKYIGLAYQIQDDLLEVFADSNKMNKSLHSDFLLDKKTYPWILSISENKNKMLEIKSAMHEDIDSGILKYRKFLDESGLKEQIVHRIEEYINLAKIELDNISANTDEMIMFSDLILKREY